MSINRRRFEEILDTFSQHQPILVLGDIGLDKYTFGEVRRISPEAPVPILEVEREWTKLGLAANVSDNLAALGATSTLCGVVGEDLHGQEFLGKMQEANLSTAAILQDSKRPTTFKERVTTATQQVCRIDYESCASLTTSLVQKFEKTLQNAVADQSALVIEDYGKGLASEELFQSAIELFQSSGKLVAVDPSRITPPLFYRGADLLKPNLSEAIAMSVTLGGSASWELKQMCNFLVEKLDLKQLVITLGAEGMAIFDTQGEQGFSLIPTLAAEVFDVSGAGDTAISALVCALIGGASLKEASWIANCASGVVVAKKGTARVDQAELLEFFLHRQTQIG